MSRYKHTSLLSIVQFVLISRPLSNSKPMRKRCFCIAQVRSQYEFLAINYCTRPGYVVNCIEFYFFTILKNYEKGELAAVSNNTGRVSPSPLLLQSAASRPSASNGRKKSSFSAPNSRDGVAPSREKEREVRHRLLSINNQISTFLPSSLTFNADNFAHFLASFTWVSCSRS